MDWAAYRDEFPILQQRTYLNSCSLGALSGRVRSAINRHLDLWDRQGAKAWYGPWMEELAETRQRVADLIGAREDEVAIMPNISTALSVVGSGLDLEARSKLVSSEMDFPTDTYQFHANPEVDVDIVKSPDGVTVPPEAIEARLDEDTAALVTSHVLFTSGYIQEVDRLCRAAEDAGALSIIDAYQATGQLPTDVRSMGCDVLITGGLKWLLGGTGIAYLYVSRAAQERLAPTLAGWFGDEEQFAFDTTRFRPRPDARRYELGTPALPSVHAGNAGLEIVQEIGPKALRDRQTELVDDLYDRFEDRGFRLATPADPDQRAGILMVELPDPQDTVDKLADRGIIVDSRPGRLRISPYFYNTLEETAEIADAVLEIEGQAHRR